MPRRKRKVEEHSNHERWLVSYADFITLLFAFFVVMYSVSSVNDGKFRVLSNSLDGAFKGEARSMDMLQIGDIIQNKALIERLMQLDGAGDKPIVDLFSDNAPAVSARIVDNELEDSIEVKEEQALSQLEDNLSDALSDFIDEELISVEKTDLWVEIEMKSSLLFSSGSATLSNEALRVLWKVAKPIRRLNNHVQVEGFTDNIPISSFEYPSNWELSASRASSVVHLFTKYGISPDRLAAVGYGSNHPIEDNESAEGRDSNRRVVIVIQSNAIARFSTKDKNKDKGIKSVPEIKQMATELEDAFMSTPEESSSQIKHKIKDRVPSATRFDRYLKK